MNCSTYTGNDYYFPWNRGSNSLATVNTETRKRREIKDFWLYLQKGRDIEPIFCISSKQGNKYFGVGVDQESRQKLLVFYQNDENRSCRLLSSYKEQIEDVLQGELSRAGKVLFLLAKSSEGAKILAVEFKQNLSILNEFVLDGDKDLPVGSITRVLGTNYLAIGGYRVVYIVEFASFDDGFKKIRYLDALPNGHISSMFFHSDAFFCFCQKEEVFFKIAFEKKMDYLNFYIIEHLWYIKKHKDDLDMVSSY